MSPSPADTGVIIDKVERFGERFGFPAIIAIMVTTFFLIGMYRILSYAIGDHKMKVDAMAIDMGKMMSQHAILIETSMKSIEIQCATCWNAAENQAEIKRCSCSTK